MKCVFTAKLEIYFIFIEHCFNDISVTIIFNKQRKKYIYIYIVNVVFSVISENCSVRVRR